MGFLGANSIFLPPEQRANFQGNTNTTLAPGDAVPGVPGLTFQGSSTGDPAQFPNDVQGVIPDRFTSAHPNGINNPFFQGLDPSLQNLQQEIDTQFNRATGHNQEIIDQILGQINTSRSNALGAIQGARDQLDLNVPLNPFSDQIREMQFNQINDTLRRQGRDAVAVQQAALASRGVLGGGQFADIQRQSEATGRAASTAADVGLRTTQQQTNIDANALRQDLTQRLTGLESDVQNKFGTLEATIPTLNAIDPFSFADIATQLQASQAALDIEGRLADIAQFQHERSGNIASAVLEGLGLVLALQNPKSGTAQAAPTIGREAGGTLFDLFHPFPSLDR